MGLSMAERSAVTKQMARRYERATKTQKGLMLDELCALTGWTRRHARRALAEAIRPSPVLPGRGRGRPKVYGDDVLVPLRQVWATLNGPTGKRLAPFMAEIVAALERAGELEVGQVVRDKLLAISAATIDRLLAPERKRLQIKGRTGTTGRSSSGRSRSERSRSGTSTGRGSARWISSPTRAAIRPGSSARPSP